jgi:type VI secretion system protein ImpB
METQMPRESTQKRLERDRPPRVQLTYDVEVGDALETKELPFVLGVVGDLTGHPETPLPRLKDRSFVQIDPDTFDDVLRGMAPRLQLQVEDRLRDDGGRLGLVLRFERLEDFEPAGIVRQVEPLRRLLEARERLADLRNRMAGNDRLEELLDGVVHDPERLRTLGAAMPAEPEDRP